MNIAYKLPEIFNVRPIQRALAEHDIWNKRTMRTEHPSSPHYGLDDIWARFAHPNDDHAVPHTSVWYDDVCDVVPIKDLANEVLQCYPGVLGGVLLTRIKPGKLCRPHTDFGWHASHYYFKVMVSIQADEYSAFCFNECMQKTVDGEAIFFDNSKEHWVPNIGSRDRISAIICIRPQTAARNS